MSLRANLNYTNFTVATLLSTLIAALIIGVSYYLGKSQFFLLLNTDLGKPADYFFQYFTNMGDGLLWIVWVVVVFKTKQSHLYPLIVASFILTTVFTQIFKYFILPDELRPSKAIADPLLIHFVKGVTVHATSSFPSGHTATAFTFVLLIALIMRRRFWMYVGLLVALLVGYSRIYLGQHFPLDIGAGILVSIFSVSLSILIYKRFAGTYVYKE